jgi:hypothetical protein
MTRTETLEDSRKALLIAAEVSKVSKHAAFEKAWKLAVVNQER